MGEMADYYFDEMLAFGQCDGDFPENSFYQPPEGQWIDGEGLLLDFSEMSDEHISAAIGWCTKYFPEDSVAKVAELKAEQCRREFG